MKRITLSLVAALASLSLTACLDDGTAAPQDPEQEPGQIDLDQAPSDQPDITETVDPGTSTQVIPHGDHLDDAASVQISGVNVAGGNSTTCCVSLKAPAQKLPVAGRN